MTSQPPLCKGGLSFCNFYRSLFYYINHIARIWGIGKRKYFVTIKTALVFRSAWFRGRSARDAASDCMNLFMQRPFGEPINPYVKICTYGQAERLLLLFAPFSFKKKKVMTKIERNKKMKKILQEIWYGRTERFDKVEHHQELLKMVHSMENTQKMLTETFTKEQNTLFEEYEKQTQDISGIAEKEAFINGLRYGANFILAILEEK